jgi:type II secretory pathway pseudopilin PulG
VQSHRSVPKSVGFTLVEVLLAVGLMALTAAMITKLIPSFITPNDRVIDHNNLGSLNTLREIVRLDLADSNAGSVIEDRPYSIYVCRYNPQHRCIPLDQSGQQTGLAHGRYCIASSSAGDLQGQDRQVNRFVMYRGKGTSFEYFYAQNDMDDFAGISIQGGGSMNGNNDPGTLVQQVLRSLCEASFEQTPVGLKNASWIRLNNPEVLPLESFMLCGIKNDSFESLMSTSPPNQCWPVDNQTGSQGADCRPGENGINALMIYYRFQRNLSGGVSNSSPGNSSFSDVVMVNFPAKPCIVR